MTGIINTKLPNPDTFKESLDAHCSGKWYAFVSFFGVAFLGFGNMLNELPQAITLYIFAFYFIYLIIPTSFYMKGYHWFFVNSWLVGVTTVALFTYAVTLNLYRLEVYIDNLNLYTYAIIFIIFIIDFFEKRRKLIVYRNIISNSIDQHVFYVERWLIDLEESKTYQGMSFALWVGLIILGIVIVVGSMFGGGLMTAKVLLNSGFDFLVEVVIGFGLFGLNMFILSRFTHETLKLVAAYQVSRELNKTK